MINCLIHFVYGSPLTKEDYDKIMMWYKKQEEKPKSTIDEKPASDFHFQIAQSNTLEPAEWYLDSETGKYLSGESLDEHEFKEYRFIPLLDYSGCDSCSVIEIEYSGADIFTDIDDWKDLADYLVSYFKAEKRVDGIDIHAIYIHDAWYDSYNGEYDASFEFEGFFDMQSLTKIEKFEPYVKEITLLKGIMK
jgi:hypothetical protein